MNNEIVYDSESLKKDLRTMRIIELEISLDDCANRIGISKPTLSRVENGNVVPDLLTFFKIVRWLNSNPMDYIKYT